MTPVLAEPYVVVCPDTRELPVPQWLGLRRSIGFGGTDAPVANGVSTWKSTYTGFAEFTGLIEPEGDRDRFLIGRVFEGPVLELWAYRYGYDLSEFRRHVMVRSIEYPFMFADPDALGATFGVEAKTADSNDEARWAIRVPEQYLYQVMHYMVVTGLRRWVLVVMFGYSLPVEFWIDWDEDLANEMIAGEREFLRRIQENDPPDIDGSNSTLKTMRQRYYNPKRMKAKALPSGALGLIEQYEVAHGHVTELKKGENRIKSTLLEHLGDAEIGTIDDVIVVTAKKAKDGSRRFNFPDRAA